MGQNNPQKFRRNDRSFFQYQSVIPTELIDNELVNALRLKSGATKSAKPTAFQSHSSRYV